MRNTLDGRNGQKTMAGQMELPQAAFSASCHCMWAKDSLTVPSLFPHRPRAVPGAQPAPRQPCSIPAPVPSILNPGSWVGGHPTALHSPSRSPGSYYDFLAQRDSLMKWKRTRRSRLNGSS